MTRTEFIHQVVIAMAGKVIRHDGGTEGDAWEYLLCEADILADTVEKHTYEFDEE